MHKSLDRKSFLGPKVEERFLKFEEELGES
jgi:hypothetical protein